MNLERGRRRERKRRKASGVYRLEALFGDGQKEPVTIKDKTYYVEGRLGEHCIVSVPETTTRASATDLERKLTEIVKKPVLVVTHNMTFLKATLLSGKEQAKIIDEIKKSANSEDSENADSPQ